MAGIIPDVGRTLALRIVLNNARNPRLRLFKNNLTLSRATVLGDFTECNFEGYAAQALPDWSVPTVNINGSGVTKQPEFAFTMGVPGVSNTVYGYWLTIEDMAGIESLLYCEKFSMPQSMALEGDSIPINISVFDTQVPNP